MAKIKGVPPGTKPLRIRGAVSARYNTRLGFIAQSWPSKTSNMNSPLRVRQREDFSKAVALIKNATGEELQAATDYALGTQFLPRDMLMAAAFGTLIEMIAPDGTIWRSARIVKPEAQILLDSISAVEGAMLYRNSLGWVALAPGSADQVITLDGPSGLPNWAAIPSQTASGPAGGDLSGTYPNPLLRNIGNVNAGTLPQTHGGTGGTWLSSPGEIVFGDTGNAYRTDTSWLYYDAINVRMGVGTKFPQAKLVASNNATNGNLSVAPSTGTILNLISDDTHNGTLEINTWGGLSGVFTTRAAGGTKAAPTRTISGQLLQQISAQSYRDDNNTYSVTALMRLQATQDRTSTAGGTQYTFQTTEQNTLQRLDRIILTDHSTLEFWAMPVDLTYSKNTWTTGFNKTIPDNCSDYIITPAGTLATGTLKMCATPYDGMTQTIYTTKTITALTHNANTGQTLQAPLATLLADTSASWKYIASTSTWYRRN